MKLIALVLNYLWYQYSSLGTSTEVVTRMVLGTRDQIFFTGNAKEASRVELS